MFGHNDVMPSRMLCYNITYLECNLFFIGGDKSGETYKDHEAALGLL